MNGIIFILFIAGYLFYFILRVARLMQKKKWLIGILSAVAVISIIISLYRTHISSFGTDHTPVEIIIRPKMSLHDVADTLKAHGVIKSPRILRAWMRFKKMERKMQAGLVIVHHGDGVQKAADKLLRATPLEISLMVPEGLTIEQTAYQISGIIPIDTAKFIALCYDSGFIAGCSLSTPSLEGYLYPDTYRFPEKVSEQQILRRMVAMHHEVWSKLTIAPSLNTRYTHHQFVTLASIVEREATLLSEQPHISGVFHNRLEKGYPLGADPTVRFALKKFGGPLRVSELNCSSPYNTRRYTGLPPGPICSPGEGALAAAVAPLDTRDLYFVAKWDGSGEHDFSETNAEHDRKKLNIRRRNQKRLKRKANSGK